MLGLLITSLITIVLARRQHKRTGATWWFDSHCLFSVMSHLRHPFRIEAPRPGERPKWGRAFAEYLVLHPVDGMKTYGWIQTAHSGEKMMEYAIEAAEDLEVPLPALDFNKAALSASERAQKCQERTDSADEAGGDEREGEGAASTVPSEVREALAVLDDAAKNFEPAAFHLVSDRVRQVITARPAEFAEIIRKGRPVRHWVYSAISNAAGDLVESGEYRIYRGTLNPSGPGESLVEIFDGAADELCRLEAVGPAFVAQQKAGLRRNIREVG